MFEKSLTDLIRGIRANKANQESYILTALDEIRQEIVKPDLATKANAVSKLTLLHMMGYDMTWASFHVIQVMSSTSRSQKRIGYYAAAVSFHPDIDVLMLCTNLIRKDMSSNDQKDGSLAMHTLAQIVTPDLARDLHTDVITALNHSNPYMRKRAVLVLYRIFVKYPEAIRVGFARLKEKLDDQDPGVVSAAVNVLCELARKNPKSYLPLAPQLYALLTRVSSNWMIIKIVKLFASMTLLEPRLVKKLLPPLVNLIQTTTAMSVMYECIQTILVGGMIPPENELDGQPDQVAQLCLSKLQVLIQDPDQNLKYLGLQALGKLLPLRPNAVAEYGDVILECLRDHDASIRLRALDLVCSLSTANNLFSIVKRLMLHLQQAQKLPTVFDATYRTKVVSSILNICSEDTYAKVPDFEWYIGVLLELARIPGSLNSDIGERIAEQLIDICVRVKDVEGFLVSSMATLLQDKDMFDAATREANNVDVLYAAAWICGEYVFSLDDIPATMKTFMQTGIKRLPGRIQSVFLQNLYKLFVYWVSKNVSLTEKTPDGSKEGDLDTSIPTAEAMVFVGNALLHFLADFQHHSDLEVQDCACIVSELVRLLLADLSRTEDDKKEATYFHWVRIQPHLFRPEFNPVSKKAQKRVPVPEGLSLDEWIFEPESEKESPADISSFGKGKRVDWLGNGSLDEMFPGHEDEQREQAKEDPEELARRRQERLARIKNDPFYLQTDVKSVNVDSKKTVDERSAIGDVEAGSTTQKQPQQSQPRSRSKSPYRPPQKKTYRMKREEDVDEASHASPERRQDSSTKKKAFSDYTEEELEELRQKDPDTYAVLSVDISNLLLEEQEKLESRPRDESEALDEETATRRGQYQDLSAPKLRKKKANSDLKSPVLESAVLVDVDEVSKKADATKTKKKKKKSHKADKDETRDGDRTPEKKKKKKRKSKLEKDEREHMGNGDE